MLNYKLTLSNKGRDRR